MKKEMKKAVKLLAGVCLLLFLVPAVNAANTDFTANGEIIVTGVTLGSGTADVTILNGSTAESWSFNNGVFTVVNSGGFRVVSSNSQAASLRVVNTSTGGDACVTNVVPGTTYISVPVDGGTYRVEISTSGCSSGGGTGSSGGANTPSTPSTPEIISGSVKINAEEKAIQTYLDNQSTLTVLTSAGTSSSYSMKVTSLDLVDKKVTLLFGPGSIELVLLQGESKNVDLDKDGTNDIKVSFNSLTGDKANLSLVNLVILEKLASLGVSYGGLIKMAPTASQANSAVYYVDADGRKHLFVNGPVFWSWYGGSWSNITFGSIVKTVTIVPQTSLDALTEGVHVAARPGSLVKFTNSPRAYALDDAGVLHKLENESAATALYGTNWLTKVAKVQPGFAIDYNLTGSVLTSTSAYPDGSLVKWTGSLDVYYVQDGKKRLINTEALLANGLKDGDVRTAPATVTYSVGSPVTAAETSLKNVAGE